MSLVFPNTQEVEILTNRLISPLTIKLYGNDVTPSGSSSTASFNEISGGGYTNFPIILADWTITAGNPTIALCNAIKTWTFTGAIAGPGTIYGYFITRDIDGLLLLAERFASGVIPFSPINGSVIKVLPKITCESA